MKHLLIILLSLLVIIPVSAAVYIENFNPNFGDAIHLQPQWIINSSDTVISPVYDTDSVFIGGETTSTAEFVFDVWTPKASTTGDWCLSDGTCLSNVGASGGGAWEDTGFSMTAITPTTTGFLQTGQTPLCFFVSSGDQRTPQARWPS